MVFLHPYRHSYVYYIAYILLIDPLEKLQTGPLNK